MKLSSLLTPLWLTSLLVITPLALVHSCTRPRIEANEAAYAHAQMRELLPPALRQRTDITWHAAEQTNAAYYDVVAADQLIGYVQTIRTGRAYGGPIDLQVATDPGGHIQAVRLLRHHETPGLGDRVEARHSRWLEQFTGRRVGDGAARLSTDGGTVDALTGATITSRAIATALASEAPISSSAPDATSDAPVAAAPPSQPAADPAPTR